METYVYTSAFSIFAFTTLMALSLRQTVGALPRFFVIYLCLESLGFVFEWIIHTETVGGDSIALTALIASSLLVAPCMWLFAKEVGSYEPPKLSSLSRWHWLVIVLGMILLLPRLPTFNLTPSYVPANRVISEDWWFFLHATTLVTIGVFVVQVVLYWRWSFRILAENTGGSGWTLFQLTENRHLNALRLIMIAVAVNWFVSIMRTLHCMSLGPPTNYSLALTCIEICVAISALFFIMRKSPTELQFRPTQREENTKTANTDDLAAESQQADLHESSGNQTDKDEEKYAKSSIDEHRRQRIVEKITKAMEMDKLFLNNVLSLQTLSDYVGEKTHYVSQAINQELNTSFFDLVNTYRIRHAKEMLLDDSRVSVLTVAESAGFNSKSTFNAAFRKHTDMTPTQFRAAH